MWSNLKNAIESVIKTNGTKAITGQVLQDVLNNNIVDELGASEIKGVASLTTNPGVPDGTAIWFLGELGTYPNFSSITIYGGEVAYAEWDGTKWVKKFIGVVGGDSPQGVANTSTQPATNPNTGDWYWTEETGDYPLFNVNGVSAGGRLVFNGSEWVFISDSIPKFNVFIETDPTIIGAPSSGKSFIGTYGGKLWVKLSDGSVDYNNVNGFRGFVDTGDAVPANLQNGDWVRAKTTGTYTNFSGVSANAGDRIQYSVDSTSWGVVDDSGSGDIALTSDMDAANHKITNLKATGEAGEAVPFDFGIVGFAGRWGIQYYKDARLVFDPDTHTLFFDGNDYITTSTGNVFRLMANGFMVTITSSVLRRTITPFAGNTYITVPIPIADVSYTLDDLTISDSIPTGHLVLAHLINENFLDSYFIMSTKSPEYLAFQASKSIKYYSDKKLYWDGQTQSVILIGIDDISDIVFSFNYKGQYYYIMDDVHSVDLSGSLGGNSDIYLVISEGVIEYDISHLVRLDSTPDLNTHIPIAHIVHDKTISPNKFIADIIEYNLKGDAGSEYSLFPKYYDDRRIVWDGDDEKLLIVGRKSVRSPETARRVVAIKYKGLDYEINDSITEKQLSFTPGNNQIVLNLQTGKTSYSLADITIVAGVTISDPNQIKLAHLTLDRGLRSQLILPKKLVPSLTGILSHTDPFDRLKTLKSSDKDCQTITWWGDSIYASGFKDTVFPDENGNTLYEQPPRSCAMQSFQRSLYFHLNGNNVTWRNARHEDWSYTGTIADITSSVMPNVNEQGMTNSTQFDTLVKLSDGATAKITITGAKKAMFFFEAGRDAYATGTVAVSVKVNGGAANNPSDVLKGRTNKKGFGDSKVFDTAENNFDTSFTAPEALTKYNHYAAYKKLVYNGLDENLTYEFTFTVSGNDVKLWGTGYTLEEKIYLVYNNSKPGFDWNGLMTVFTSDMLITETDLVILEAPKYHDHNLSDAELGAREVMSALRDNQIDLILNSCPPASVIVQGAPTANAGDELSSSYIPGMHMQKITDFGRTFILKTAFSGTDDNPEYGEEYTCTINGTDYVCTARRMKGNYNLTDVFFEVPEDFPNQINEEVTFTKTKSNSGSTSVASFIAASMNDWYTSEMHARLMADLALEYNVPFVDIFRAFEDMAQSVGEDIYSPAFDMDSGNPLYAPTLALVGNPDYPLLQEPFQMNYLSNFFFPGDGHHLAYPAHPVIWEIIRKKCFNW